MRRPVVKLRRPVVRLRATLLAALTATALLSACTGGASTSPSVAPPSHPPYSPRPNIVFVLTDDLSQNLMPYMPHVRALSEQGMTFSNYGVTDSLCCPSRASIFTGKFPHNTGVFTNIAPDGGLLAFNRHGGPKASYAYALQHAGYRTALLGKYLNNYLVGEKLGDLPENYIPEGWSTWAVGAGAYRNFNYKLNQDGKIVSYGSRPQDYLTRVITRIGVSFIERSVQDRTPFALELSTYSPHDPYVPDPVDVGTFDNLNAPRGPSFNRVPAHAPVWLSRSRTPLSVKQVATLDAIYRKRVESVQSVDRSIGELQATLKRTGQLANTVFVFSSDNGYHLGEHGLNAGKRTAFDTDVHVPLVIAGPGIAHGATSSAMVQNIDLAPTFEDFAKLAPRPTVDGRSMVPLLQGRSVPWRTRTVVEHHGQQRKSGDPDAQPRAAGTPPTYDSLRSASWTYTRYTDGEREYYDRAVDPYETNNLAATLTPEQQALFNRELDALTRCKGAVQCWAAGRPERS